jgi:superfamily II DNA or RNA helicase
MRDYQRECVEAVERAWEGGMRRPGVVLPTGAGKTVVFAHAIDRWRRANVGRRALVVAHRHELIEQAASKLRSVMPGTRVGVVKANRNETLYPVVVASIQTLIQQSRRRQLLDVGLIVVDEAHHAAAPTYVTVLEHFGALGAGQDGAKALGVTATMVRGDDKALGEIWQDVVYSRSIAEMIAEGWLVRPRGIRVRVQDLDLGGVRKYRGDYSETALGAALEDSLAPEAVAKAMAEHAMLPDGTVRPTLLFAPLVRTAELFRDALRDAGFSAEVLSGKSTPEERERVLESFKRRDVQIVCNAMLFTEGTDLPLVSCLVIARPTLNPGLYVQMVGRALRPDIGKDDALVLDVVGVAQRHRLAVPVDLFGTESADGLEDGGIIGDAEFESEFEDESKIEQSALSLDDFEPSWRNGPIVSEHIDLFHGSDSVWLRTSGAGVWFLAPGERYIAILPGQAGGYDVVTMHQTRRGDSKWIAQGVESLSYAMGWAEDSVTAAERRLTTREQSWRATTPTTEQRRLAKRLGIEIQRGMTAGELRSRCMVVAATFRIDPGIPAYLARGRS